MHTIRRSISSLLFAALNLSPALTQAQQVTSEQRMLIAATFSEAQGFAAGIAAAEAQRAGGARPAGSQAKTVRTLGVTVTYMPVQDSSSIIPHEVNADSTQAVQRVSKWLGEAQRSSITQLLGQPAEQSATSMKFIGPAEICQESLVLRFAADKVTKATWTFCTD